jgi:3-keto-5-aminohexanoate cleavage enzyme
MEKLIINAAITGMVPTKDDNPDLPCSPEEIIADVRRCRNAGASIVHIHARDELGRPTYRKEIYYEIINGIRMECPDILICGSASGRVYREFWQRSAVLEPGPDCKPDLASLTLGSMNFPNHASVNEPEMIKMLANAMSERGIVPEWEVFELGMIDYAQYLIRKGILVRPYYCNIFLGSLGTLSATPYNLAAMIRALPSGTIWSAAGIGRFQFYVSTMAVTMGGHVRVGLEDNLYYDADKKKLATNAGLIDRIVEVAQAIGRPVASPAEAREIIGMTSPRIKMQIADVRGWPRIRSKQKTMQSSSHSDS